MLRYSDIILLLLFHSLVHLLNLNQALNLLYKGRDFKANKNNQTKGSNQESKEVKISLSAFKRKSVRSCPFVRRIQSAACWYGKRLTRNVYLTSHNKYYVNRIVLGSDRGQRVYVLSTNAGCRFWAV